MVLGFCVVWHGFGCLSHSLSGWPRRFKFPRGLLRDGLLNLVLLVTHDGHDSAYSGLVCHEGGGKTLSNAVAFGALPKLLPKKLPQRPNTAGKRVSKGR